MIAPAAGRSLFTDAYAPPSCAFRLRDGKFKTAFFPRLEAALGFLLEGDFDWPALRAEGARPDVRRRLPADDAASLRTA